MMLGRVLARGQRALVICGSPERVEALNGLLWSYDDTSFLPHGSPRDGKAEDQPVLLSDSDAPAANGAKVLFLTDGASSHSLEDYDLAAVIFDGKDEEALAAVRLQWRDYKDAGHALTYWQQDDEGRWSEKS